jgi:hypothetical protein
MGGEVQEEVVEDGGVSGGRGSSGGGRNRRRRLRRFRGLRRAIEQLWWLMWSGECTRRLRRERGVERCEEIVQGVLVFIGWRGDAGVRMRLIMAATIGAAKRQESGRVRGVASWRS